MNKTPGMVPGVPVQRGSEHQNPKAIDPVLTTHIREFVPECTDPAELAQRQALLKARDYAAHLRSRVVSPTALEHAAAAHEMAGAFVFAGVPTARLEIATAYCRNLVHAAFLADHLAGEVWQ